MTGRVNCSPSPLRDVLYELSMAKEVPDAELLDDFISRYPTYAAAITEFAIEVVAEAMRSAAIPVAETSAAVSAEVFRAMSTYQNALFARSAKAKAAAVAAPANSTVGDAPNLFAELDRQGFRTLAAKLQMNSVLLMKLRDRQIDPATVTEGFRQFVADKLAVAKSAVDSFFASAAPRLASQFYKADSKPAVQSQQSFESAVRASGLNEAQQKYLLDL